MGKKGLLIRRPEAKRQGGGERSLDRKTWSAKVWPFIADLKQRKARKRITLRPKKPSGGCFGRNSQRRKSSVRKEGRALSFVAEMVAKSRGGAC